MLALSKPGNDEYEGAKGIFAYQRGRTICLSGDGSVFAIDVIEQTR